MPCSIRAYGIADMANISEPMDATVPEDRPFRRALQLLWRDKFALASACFLLFVALVAIVGPILLGSNATTINLLARNAPPFSLNRGWLYVLGADSLGRSILARLAVGSRNTLGIASAAVLTSMVVGALLGLVAGYRNSWLSNLIMRAADVAMSFPSLLLALIVLYVLGGSNVWNVILVLAVTRVPVYLRTCRAEVLEIRERLFVAASRALGARPRWLIFTHILPIVMSTLWTLATLNFAIVMLSESSLSFLGLGLQPPEISWGVMVAEGKPYLGQAWWLCFWPGLAITLTAMALNLLAGWIRLASDPVQRWRLETSRPS
jgi:peptide/nickel transport system permease protein